MSTEKNQPLVSVIIAAYNASDFIAATIDSILKQTYTNIEIIVSDDASTDNTKTIVESLDAKIKCIWNEQNKGPCAARNKGLELAKGEFISFFDADDLMLPNKLESQVEALIKTDNQICVGDYINFSEAGLSNSTHFNRCLIFKNKIERRADLQLSSLESRLLLIDDNFSITGSTVYKKSCLDQVGGFNEALKASTDFELIYRAASISGITVINKPVMHRRQHQNNITADKSRVIKHLIISRESLLKSEKNKECRRRLKKRIAGYIASNIYLAGKLHQKKNFVLSTIKLLVYLPFTSRKDLALSAAGLKRLITKKRAL